MHISRAFTFSSLLAAASCWQPRNAGKPHNSGLTVQTTSGEVHGFINSTAPQVRQFLGIPYAEPPLGSLRFAAPKAKAKGKPINATAFAPSCMQQFSNQSTIYTEVVPQFLINGGQSEDCLYLNVWAPLKPSTKPLPVFFYVPGGGFTSGGADSLYKIPDKWIQRTQSHIVVVLNYRVNVFGFPNAKGLEDRNVGLLDQRLAVEWTRDNIAAFGGDPNRITLWGQSAGGASVSLFTYAYPSDPIVTGIIADSGSAGIAGGRDLAQTNFTYLAGLVGCKDLDPEAEVECVRKVPAKTLEDTLSNYIISGQSPKISFQPIPDNKTAFTNTTDRILKGLVAKIPAIMGSNSNEGAGFVAYTNPGPSPEALKSANVIACPSAREVRNRALGSLPTYRYLYAGNFSNISPVSWMGAYHSAELPLLFGTHYEYRGPSTPFEWEVSHKMEALWFSFAANPQAPPTLPGKHAWKWPQFSPEVDSLVLFAEDGKAIQVVSGEVVDADCGL